MNHALVWEPRGEPQLAAQEKSTGLHRLQGQCWVRPKEFTEAVKDHDARPSRTGVEGTQRRTKELDDLSAEIALEVAGTGGYANDGTIGAKVRGVWAMPRERIIGEAGTLGMKGAVPVPRRNTTAGEAGTPPV